MSVNAQGEPTSYLCQINEYQRKMLSLAIHAAILYAPTMFNSKPGDVFSSDNDTMLQELQSFNAMLLDLHEIERKEPGLIHGLCI